MPQFTVTLPKGSRADALEKFLKEKYKGITVSIRRDDPPESRADRLAVAESYVEDAKADVECLRDELQDWRDNLPENLQSGSKADELDEAVSALDTIIDSLDSAAGEFSSVSFPSMF